MIREFKRYSIALCLLAPMMLNASAPSRARALAWFGEQQDADYNALAKLPGLKSSSAANSWIAHATKQDIVDRHRGKFSGSLKSAPKATAKSSVFDPEAPTRAYKNIKKAYKQQQADKSDAEWRKAERLREQAEAEHAQNIAAKEQARAARTKKKFDRWKKAPVAVAQQHASRQMTDLAGVGIEEPVIAQPESTVQVPVTVGTTDLDNAALDKLNDDAIQARVAKINKANTKRAAQRKQETAAIKRHKAQRASDKAWQKAEALREQAEAEHAQKIAAQEGARAARTKKKFDKWKKAPVAVAQQHASRQMTDLAGVDIEEPVIAQPESTMQVPATTQTTDQDSATLDKLNDDAIQARVAKINKANTKRAAQRKQETAAIKRHKAQRASDKAWQKAEALREQAEAEHAQKIAAQEGARAARTKKKFDKWKKAPVATAQQHASRQMTDLSGVDIEEPVISAQTTVETTDHDNAALDKLNDDAIQARVAKINKANTKRAAQRKQETVAIKRHKARQASDKAWQKAEALREQAEAEHAQKIAAQEGARAARSKKKFDKWKKAPVATAQQQASRQMTDLAGVDIEEPVIPAQATVETTDQDSSVIDKLNDDAINVRVAEINKANTKRAAQRKQETVAIKRHKARQASDAAWQEAEQLREQAEAEHERNQASKRHDASRMRVKKTLQQMRDQDAFETGVAASKAQQAHDEAAEKLRRAKAGQELVAREQLQDLQAQAQANKDAIAQSKIEFDREDKIQSAARTKRTFDKWKKAPVATAQKAASRQMADLAGVDIEQPVIPATVGTTDLDSTNAQEVHEQNRQELTAVIETERAAQTTRKAVSAQTARKHKGSILMMGVTGDISEIYADQETDYIDESLDDSYFWTAPKTPLTCWQRIKRSVARNWDYAKKHPYEATGKSLLALAGIYGLYRGGKYLYNRYWKKPTLPVILAAKKKSTTSKAKRKGKKPVIKGKKTAYKRAVRSKLSLIKARLRTKKTGKKTGSRTR